MTQNDFAFRIDRWTDDGEHIVEHVAGAEDFQTDREFVRSEC